MASSNSKNVSQKDIDLVRTAAENDLTFFIELIAPQRVLGAIHKEVISWWTRQGAKSHQLLLLPRDHGKSALVAYRVAWEITRNPAITVLYISATENLAKKQLRAIKEILTSSTYRAFWPDMVLPEEAKRAKWSETEICVDHPLRQKEGIRDNTVEAGGITKTLTGLHCDLCVLDDVVVPENAYTEEGRSKVATLYSYLASIESATAKEIVVGTRYYIKDLYDYLANLSYNIYDNEGNVKDTTSIYEVFERTVEDSVERDGSGQFLWPVQKRKDGKMFGFDRNILEKKKKQYQDKSKFYAQYYNDPSDPGSARIAQKGFQYYNKDLLVHQGGAWHFKSKQLAIYAGMDFAWSLNKGADYSAIVVIGVTSENEIYVLDIDRFKTDQLSVMWDHLLRSHVKWRIRKVQVETNAAQKVIVNQFKTYAMQQGSDIKLEEVYRTGRDGSKLERNTAILAPRYDQGLIWHFHAPTCQLLEEELTSGFPEHDDIEDALASAVEVAKPCASSGTISLFSQPRNIVYHPRFGGVIA